ncbi:MAG: hypothetical protein JXN60_02085 [Lentisphaerae bacterium]|nr:hypothetical protein [Lentisphaerota bacterium]
MIKIMFFYLWSLTLIVNSGNSIILGITACVFPMTIYWRWARHAIPIVVLCLVPYFHLDVKFGYLVLLGMILWGNCIFFPNRSRLEALYALDDNESIKQPALFYQHHQQRQLFYEVMLPILFVAPFMVYVVTQYLTSDFWYDEVNALQTFIFVPLIKTVTDYHTTNNHVFFDVLSNIYMKLLGIKDIYTLMDIPGVMRLSVLGYSLCAIFYIYRICLRFFNRFIGLCAILILVTTLPFYNVVVQIRGYALSMMLLSMLLYYVWNFIDHGNRSDALWIIGLASLSLYTIPLNLYYLITIAIFYCIAWLYSYYIENRHKRASYTLYTFLKIHKQTSRMLILVLLIGLSVLLAFVLYLPVLPSVKADGVVTKSVLQSHGFFNFFIIRELMPVTFQYFISDRLLLIVMALLGSSTIFLIQPMQKNRLFLSKYVLCIGLLFMPFMLSFIRGDMPLTRIFVNLTPIFALWAAISVYLFLYNFTALSFQSKTLQVWIILMLFSGYHYWMFIEGIHKRNQFVRERNLQDNIEIRRVQDIFYNYYQTDFHPLALVRGFAQHVYDPNIPVIVAYDEEVDGRSITRYLEKFDIPYQRLYYIDPHVFQQLEQMYMITAYPERFKKIFAELHSDLQCTSVNQMIDFHHIFLCRKHHQ